MMGVHVVTSVDVAAQTDYGDAPDLGAGIGPGDYETFAANGGARHTLNPVSPFLGNCVDADSGAIANGAATADNLSTGFSTFGTCSIAGDDEDSVVVSARPSPNVVSTSLQITMTAASPADCILNAWIDFNQNGDFTDSGEQIATEMTLLSGSGSTSLNFPVPATAILGNIFARFRCSTVTGSGPTGLGGDGEVEDYLITINNPPDSKIPSLYREREPSPMTVPETSRLHPLPPLLTHLPLSTLSATTMGEHRPQWL